MQPNHRTVGEQEVPDRAFVGAERPSAAVERGVSAGDAGAVAGARRPLAGADHFVESRSWAGRFSAFCAGSFPMPTAPPTTTPRLRGGALDPDIVAIDGANSRRTHARRKEGDPQHLLSAGASRQRSVLGQEAIVGRSDEIKAVPFVPEGFVLSGVLNTATTTDGGHRHIGLRWPSATILRGSPPIAATPARRSFPAWP